MTADSGVEDVSASIEYGFPHAAVLSHAEHDGINLVVMGAYGHTGVRRYSGAWRNGSFVHPPFPY